MLRFVHLETNFLFIYHLRNISLNKEMENLKKIITLNSVNVDENKITTVYKTGNIVELITPHHRNDSLKRIRKLDKTHYLDCETGEIKEYMQRNNRSNNIQGVQRSLATLRRIINLNFTGSNSERFLTLTYSTVMTDTNKLYRDFKNFIAALRRHYPVEYISIAEPQKSGSWHLHILLKSSTIKNLHVPIEILSELWPHGYSYIEKLPFCDNFGAYFAVRVTDIHPNDEYTAESDVPKSIIKGGRLHFYPPNFKLYRCSKHIKRPQPIQLTYGEARKLTEDMKLCFSSAKQIISVDKDGNEKTLNTICYEQYRKAKGDLYHDTIRKNKDEIIKKSKTSDE